MQEFIATIASKGRITIPVEVRRHLGITIGDKAAFVIDDDGIVRIRVLRYPTIASLRGAAGRLKKPLSWRETQKAAYEDRFE